MVRKYSSDLPPGFRFHPTDEELIMYYLRNQTTSRPCPVSIIPEIDIYKFDPWKLPEKAEFGEHEWYFFSPRDRKYPNGVRPNRAAVSGYWKATGTDKPIHSGSEYVGVKKALVFYTGKPPKGIKTDWIMHEYRLMSSDSTKPISRQNGSMRLDDWVLCRIYKKKSLARTEEQRVENSSIQTEPNNAALTDSLFPRTCSLSHLWELDCLGTLPQLLSDNSYNSIFDNNQNTMGISENDPAGGIQKFQLGEVPYQYMDSVKLEANQHHPVFQFE